MAAARRRTLARALALPAFALLCLSCGRRPPPAPAARPDVLLLTIDTLRADRLGCAGHRPARTPTLDGLAREGVRFEQARTPVPLTLPAHASILTSLAPAAHGLYDNGIGRLAPSAVTLAERMREAGYRTAAFVSAVVLDRRFGLDQGFEVYDEAPLRRLLSGGYVPERRAEETIDRALRWLGERTEPVFLWVHLYDPHAPYDPPADFAGADPYDGEIAYADGQAGRLLEALRARRGRPLVVATSDHGEGLGEHGEPTHGLFLYDTTARVPLIVAGPGVARGAVRRTSVSLLDVAPTVLDLIGLPPLPDAQGRSLAALLAGEGGRDDPRLATRALLLESRIGALDFGWSPLFALVKGDRKFVWAPRPELYDLSADPRERRNLLDGSAGGPGEWIEATRRALNAHARRPTLSQPLGGEDAASLDLAIEQLGYVAGRAGGDELLPAPDLPDPKDRIEVVAARERALASLRRFLSSGRRDLAALQEAERATREALQVDPGSVLLREQWGLCLVFSGRARRAREVLQGVVEERPERADARFALATALLLLHDRAGARRQLERCLEIDPRHVAASRTLALLCEEEGDRAGAAEAWRLFLAHYRGGGEPAEEARQALERLADS